MNTLLMETIKVFEACFERMRKTKDHCSWDSKSLAQALFSSLLGVGIVSLTRRDVSIGAKAENILETLLAQACQTS